MHDRYDVFVCYAKSDRAAVERIAQQLRDARLDVYLDDWDSLPGDSWMKNVQRAIAASRACAIVIGGDVGRWQQAEIDVLLEKERSADGFRVIPVLLPNADSGQLPGFLQRFVRIELDAVDDSTALQRLIAGIRGAPPVTTASSTRASLVERHLLVEAQRYAAARLPLPEKNRASFPLPVEAVRIDLPLQVTSLHSVAMNEGERRDAEAFQRLLRRSYTTAAFFDFSIDIARGPKALPKQHLTELLTGTPRLAIVGDPGCGKTTLLAHIAYVYASRRLPRELRDSATAIEALTPPGASVIPDRPWIPVTIFCRNATRWNEHDGLYGLLLDQLVQSAEEPQKVKALCDVLMERLHSGEALLLIDGLDEMHAARRASLAGLLAQQPQFAAIVSSRAVGFHTVAATLAPSFDQVNVLPLGIPEKQDFVRAWANALRGYDAEDSVRVERDLLPYVLRDRGTSRLCDNALFISLFAQMFVLDALPRHRRDVYRRTLEVMIERQRETASPALTFNEVWPALKTLGYVMRRADEATIREDAAAAAIGTATPDEFRSRDARQLVADLLEKLGMLNLAGSDIDADGYERRVIQFFHPSFQEYFAGQALNSEELRRHVRELSTERRRIPVVYGGRESEPVAVSAWQEALRLAIADLTGTPGKSTADDVFFALLSRIGADLDEGRALTVFALQCLAGEPEVGARTVHLLFDAAVDFLTPFDGYGNDANTTMDAALRAVMRSRYGADCHRHLLQSFLGAGEERRERIGAVLMNLYVDSPSFAAAQGHLDTTLPALHQLLQSNDETQRIDAAVQITELFFSYTNEADTLADKTPELPASIAHAVTAMLADPASASAHVAAWTLIWVVYPRELGAVIRVALDERERAKLFRIATNADAPPVTRARCLELYAAGTREAALTPSEWLDLCARVADGHRAASALPALTLPPCTMDVEPFRALLAGPYFAARRTASILARLGCAVPEVVTPLLRGLRDSTWSTSARDEALFHLATIGGDAIVDALLVEATADEVVGDDYHLPSRAYLALIGLRREDVLERYRVARAKPSAPATRPHSAVGPFRQLLIEAGTVPIHLVRCKDSNGHDCFFYILCSLRRAVALRAAFKRGPVNLTEYGEIAASGFGHEPTPEIKKTLLDIYHFDATGI